MHPEGTPSARHLFDGIASTYDRPAEVLSLGQYARWRRALVRSLELDAGARVLDVATGTGLIAAAIERRYGCRVIGADLNERMLRAGARRELVASDARALPFPDGYFDAVTFSYLLRYVEDPPATLRELARVLRSGGALASVEFGMPSARIPRAGWRMYAGGIFPLLARALSQGWREIGGFLPGSIARWAREWPIERQLAAWEAAGITGVRARGLTFGTGVVMTGRKRG